MTMSFCAFFVHAKSDGLCVIDESFHICDFMTTAFLRWIYFSIDKMELQIKIE